MCWEGEVPIKIPGAPGTHVAAKTLWLKTFGWPLDSIFLQNWPGLISKPSGTIYTPRLKDRAPPPLQDYCDVQRSQEAGMPRSVLSSISGEVKTGMHGVSHTDLTNCFGKSSNFLLSSRFKKLARKHSQTMWLRRTERQAPCFVDKTLFLWEKRENQLPPNSRCCT